MGVQAPRGRDQRERGALRLRQVGKPLSHTHPQVTAASPELFLLSASTPREELEEGN